MKKNLYFVEVGILLTPNDDDFACYQINDFHRELGFYDENKLTFLTQQEANDYAMDYVKSGINNTYAILYDYNCNITKDQLQEIKDFKSCEYSLDMSINDITEFIYKQNNEIIRENIK